MFFTSPGVIVANGIHTIVMHNATVGGAGPLTHCGWGILGNRPILNADAKRV